MFAVAGIRTLNGEEGAWEQHTRGIGSRLMAKMGHVPGQPLGANARGAAASGTGALATKPSVNVFDTQSTITASCHVDTRTADGTCFSATAS